MEYLTLATSVVPDRSLGFTVTVIVAGLGIVLATLAVLIMVFFAFGKIMEMSQQASKKKAAKKQQMDMEAEATKMSSAPAPAPTPTPTPAPVVEQGITGEVVAAISAAVYSMDGGNATIRSITRKQSPIATRNPWAQAAVVDNTRPF